MCAPDLDAIRTTGHVEQHLRLTLIAAATPTSPRRPTGSHTARTDAAATLTRRFVGGGLDARVQSRRRTVTTRPRIVASSPGIGS